MLFNVYKLDPTTRRPKLGWTVEAPSATHAVMKCGGAITPGSMRPHLFARSVDADEYAEKW